MKEQVLFKEKGLSIPEYPLSLPSLAIALIWDTLILVQTQMSLKLPVIPAHQTISIIGSTIDDAVSDNALKRPPHTSIEFETHTTKGV